MPNSAMYYLRFGKFTLIPYSSAVLLVRAAGLLNPMGVQLVWQSALPATEGAKSGSCG
jgi:hypothetical protein